MKKGLKASLFVAGFAGFLLVGIPYATDCFWRGLWTQHPLKSKKGFEKTLVIDNYEVDYKVKESSTTPSLLLENRVEEEIIGVPIYYGSEITFFCVRDRNYDGKSDDVYFRMSGNDDMLSVRKSFFNLSYDSKLMTYEQAQQLLQNGDKILKKVKENKGLEQELAEYSFGWREKEIPGIK